jgi:hypothetical protein
MDHSFNIDVAKDFGVNEAIFINNLAFWTKTNLANKRGIKDRLCWSFNTIDAFCIIFPYWNHRQIEHLTAKLEKKGCIIRGNYNKKGYDRTLWYALAPKMYKYYPEICTEHTCQLLFNSPLSAVQPASPLIPQICGMDYTNLCIAFHKFVEAIPDINTNIISDTKSSCSSNDKKANTIVSFKEKKDYDNQKKQAWTEKPKPALAGVENQSTSYKKDNKHISVFVSPLLGEMFPNLNEDKNRNDCYKQLENKNTK